MHAASERYCEDSALSAECYAALFALSTAHSLGLSSVVLEGDSLEVINLLANLDGVALWSISSLIHDCLLLSSSCFIFTLSHIKHCANSVADMLAKHEAMSSFQETWHSIPPYWLRNTLYFENIALEQPPLI